MIAFIFVIIIIAGITYIFMRRRGGGFGRRGLGRFGRRNRFGGGRRRQHINNGHVNNY